MRRIALAIVTTISGLVMLFSYHTSTAGTGAGAGASTTASSPTSGGSGSTSGGSGTTSGGSGMPSGGSGSTSGGSGSTSGGDGTYTGDRVGTRWGPMQVQITVSGGRITAATAVVHPSGNMRDEQINAYALPVLAKEAVAAQSAKIDHVSGATVTSDGYVSSLQSAIDAANL